MKKIYLKKVFYEYHEVQYCYYYDGSENKITYPNIKDTKRNEYENMTITKSTVNHEPNLLTLDDYQKKIFDKVNKLLLEAIKNDELKEEYIIELDE